MTFQPLAPTSDRQVARALKRLVWTKGSRTNFTGTQRDRWFLEVVKAQLPAAYELFGPDAIVSLLRERTGDVCGWCAFKQVADEDLVPTVGMRELLGPPCRRCVADFETEATVQRERSLTAAGYQRLRDGRLRSPTGEIRSRRVGAQAGRQP